MASGDITGHLQTWGPRLLIDRGAVTATSLSRGEASRSVCARCWWERKHRNGSVLHTRSSERGTGCPGDQHTSYVTHLHPKKRKLPACDGQFNISYQSWDKYPHIKPLPQADNVLKPRLSSATKAQSLTTKAWTRCDLGHECALGFISTISWSTNPSSRHLVAREKGLVPAIGKKKAVWGHTDFVAVVISAKKKKKLGVFMCLFLWGGRKVNY